MCHSFCESFSFFARIGSSIFQNGINLIFDHWLTFCGKPWRCDSQLKVDTDVLRFVLELTEIQWLYRLLGVRIWMFWLDRNVDVLVAFSLFTTYYFPSDPRWEFLGIYITLRVISLVLSYNAKLWKCYAVRTILSIVSGLYCIVTVAGLYLLNQSDEIRYTASVIGVMSTCALYVLPLAWAQKQIKLGDDVDQFPAELRDNCWFYRYQLIRKVLMFAYGLCIFVAFIAFQGYWLDSAPLWDVCLGIYITFLLISLPLYSNTKLCTPYTAQMLLRLIIPFVICNIALWIPFFLGTFYDIFFICLFLLFLLNCFLFWFLNNELKDLY